GAVGRETAAALGVSLLAEAPECDFENTGIFPPVLQQQASANNPLQLLTLVLMMLLKEKPMASDPAKPGQGIDPVGVLLALLVQSALGGKQIDTGQLLTDVLTGKPPALPAPAPTPSPQRQPQLSPQAPADVAALLLPLLFERLTGKPWPGPTPAELQKKPDAPNTPAQPAASRPSVQLSAGALAIGSILQALGFVGTPFGLGPTPTLNGTLATLIPIVTGVFGATGGFGGLLNAGRMLLGGLGGAAPRARKPVGLWQGGPYHWATFRRYEGQDPRLRKYSRSCKRPKRGTGGGRNRYRAGDVRRSARLERPVNRLDAAQPWQGRRPRASNRRALPQFHRSRRQADGRGIRGRGCGFGRHRYRGRCRLHGAEDASCWFWDFASGSRQGGLGSPGTNPECAILV